MSKDIEELGIIYDLEEEACKVALEKHEAARSRVGRFVTGKILAFRRCQLEGTQELLEFALEEASAVQTVSPVRPVSPAPEA